MKEVFKLTALGAKSTALGTKSTALDSKKKRNDGSPALKATAI
tara:strand:- start:485 stop:613 length:129 start_codon:yes stop_codon:yes gene_type:complete